MSKYLRADVSIAKNIVKLRKGMKLTQEQTVAKLQLMGLNYTRSRYSLIELERLNVPVSMLVALKIIFQCEYAAFFEGLDAQLTQSISKAEQDDV